MGRRGVTVRLPHIQVFEDRHGKTRYYFRKPGLPRAALPGLPDSPEFLRAYNAALNGEPPPAPAAAPGSGTFARLIEEYFKSPAFLKNKESSRTVTKGILTRFSAKHGHRPVANIQPKHLMAILGEMSETPAAANNLLKKLRALLKFGRRLDYLKHDPTADIERYKEGSHHTWTDAEIAAFEARWPLGTRQRMGFALALFTGQRRSDLVAMTWHQVDVKAGTVQVVQEKTGEEVNVPIHRDLRAALDNWPRVHVNVLGLEDGRGTSAPAFGNLMADAIEDAGLPERCVLHGLRKAAARRLAESGCTAHEIMAITGHKSLKEVQRYCDAAAKKGLGKSAIHKLELSTRRRKV